MNKNENKTSYEDLADAWQAIAKALDAEGHLWKSAWHNRVFCEVLEMCGWTLSEWNDESAARSNGEDLIIDED